MQVGIDTYSYHRYFGEIRPGEEDPGIRWTTWDFVDRAEQLGVDGVSLETCYLSLDDAVWREELTARLDQAGLERALAWGHPGGLEMGTTHDRLPDLLRAIDFAADLQAPLVRIIVGTFTHWQQEPVAHSVDRLTPIVAQACSYAQDTGVALAVETHTALPVSGIVELVQRVGPDRLGVVFDSANVVRVGSDLRQAAQQLARFTRMVHLKDLDLTQADREDPGGWWPCVALGTGQLDLRGMLQELDAANFAGMVCVELATLPAGSDEDRMVAEGVEWIRAARCAA